LKIYIRVKFWFYLELVSKEYEKQLEKTIKVAEINKKIPRILVALDKYFENNPLKSGEFGHYRPARYFTENIGELWPQIEDSNKEVFVKLFSQLNKLLE